MDNTNSMLREKMKLRRAAMEASLMSEAGSYRSDAEDTLSPTRNSGRSVLQRPDTRTEIETLSPGENTMVESLQDLEDEGDMLQDLQTRRQQRKDELSRTPGGSSGAWGEELSTLEVPSPTGDSPRGQPGPRLQQMLGSKQFNATAAGESMSLNASIRERLRSKVRGRQAAARSPDGEGTPERRLHGLRDRPLPTRFDNAGLLGLPEEEEDDADLQASIASANKWKKMVALTKQRTAQGIPTDEEAYNFFVGSMETKDGEKEGEEESQQQEPAETDELIGEKELLTFYMKPSHQPKSKQLECESKLYTVPSIRPVPLEDKVPEGVEPRYWEEEGFYVGRPPQVPYTNLSIMENRIINENKGKLWFGEDGQLKRLASPLKEKATRPSVVHLEELDPLLQTEWIKSHTEPFDGRFINGVDKESGQYQLDVDLSTLSFTHHPLFSKEHVLASRLQQFFKQYTERQRKALSSHYSDKLVALKIALQQLQENANKMGKGKTRAISVADTDKRIKEYKMQIRETKKLRDAEDCGDRALLKNILKSWRELKTLREAQGYVNTQLRVVIKREERNKDEEQALFEEELAEELQERREEFEAEYQDRLVEYEEELKEWKKEAKRKKRQQERARQEEQESGLIEGESQTNGLRPRPSRPPKFDEVAEYEKLKKNAALKRRAPGEPVLVPELLMTANVTPIDQVTRLEKQRRTEMQNWSSFIKVLFNDKEVSRTPAKRLATDFTIHFGVIHNIQIVQWPESIKLQIMESGLQSKLIAEVYLPIPEASQMSGRVELESLEFSSDQQVFYKHAGVGSGQPLDFTSNNAGELEPPVYLLTSGTILASVSWAVGNDGKPMAPPLPTGESAVNINAVRRYDALAALGAAGMVDIQKLTKWIEKSHLDPNDPANADIMNIIKLGHSFQEGPNAPQYFRLNQLEEECEFVSQKDFDKSKRFKLIQLREKGVPELKNFKMIPSRDRDIPDNIFEAYEKRQRGEQEEDVEDEIASHRVAVTKFLNKVREDVTQRSLVAKRQLELKDVITEDEVPDIRVIGVHLGQFFAPRRPLRPVRKERKVVGVQNMTISDVKIMINVVRALDIPVRQDVQPVGGAQGTGVAPGSSLRSGGPGMFSGSAPGYSGAPQGPQGEPSFISDLRGKPLVRPFVEAVFQGNFSRSTVADGPNPSWNEELILPFRAPNNDYSPETLQTVNDVVYLNLFDEMIFNISQDDRQQSTSIHQRRERHWLGSIEIPFSTIYFNNKVEGTFRVNTPPVLLGYQRRGRHSGASGDLGVFSRNDTLLTLFVTIEPPLQPSQPMAERFESNEDEKLLHNAQLWLSALRKRFPKREYKALATDLTGKKVFLTRYIRSQNPPAELLGETQYQMELLARYVSLIPYVSDSAAFPDLCDIWATSDQFLHMLAGDEEEHAVLLCNYFLHIGKTAYVVLGRGIPEGSTAYVLTTDGTKYLWNAHTGKKFDTQDANGPLKSIGCIFNHENIWGNVQQSEEPYRLMFDLSKPSSWQPFFTKSYPKPAMISVQKETLEYQPADKEYVSGLQEKIEKVLRDKIMSWRPRFVTRWNRYCTQAFRGLLSNIEQSIGQANTLDHSSELDQILASYKLSGFPINMPFTDVPPVLDAVYSTGVHTIEDPDVEFALAVHIHPYPQRVLSIWIYVSTLRRKTGY